MAVPTTYLEIYFEISKYHFERNHQIVTKLNIK